MVVVVVSVVVVVAAVVVGASDVEIVVKAPSGSGCSVASFAFRLTPVEELPFGKAKSTWQSGLGNRMRKDLLIVYLRGARWCWRPIECDQGGGVGGEAA